MSTLLNAPTKDNSISQERQVVVFRVGDFQAGVDIDLVQEINGSLAVTPTPIAPDHVRGVVNLRGEVVTVLDLHRILGLESAEITLDSANIIVRAAGESIGLLVDSIQDVLTLDAADAQPPTSNVESSVAELFESVYQLPSGLLVILNVNQAVTWM